MTPKPLFVDTDVVLQGGRELLNAAGNLPLAPPAFTPTGGADPMSVRIIAEVPFAEGPIVVELPAIKADATKTAGNIKTAAERYSQTDKAAGAQIEEAQFNPASASGSAAAGGAQNAAASQAGQMGQLGQMMGMPMQMAGQAAQLPMQALGMAAALPQGIMQGVQSAMQQVSQLGGQLGGQDEDGAKDQAEPPVEEVHRAEEAEVKPEPSREEGAAPGESGTERAPQSGGPAESPSQATPPPPTRTPAPTRPAEADDGINL
jgi:hypothetical protein